MISVAMGLMNDHSRPRVVRLNWDLISLLVRLNSSSGGRRRLISPATGLDPLAGALPDVPGSGVGLCAIAIVGAVLPVRGRRVSRAPGPRGPLAMVDRPTRLAGIRGLWQPRASAGSRRRAG